MNNTAAGLLLACLILLSGCSNKARFIQATEYLTCDTIKPLAIPTQHPSREHLTTNSNLIDLIDEYASALTQSNNRMGAIRAEADECNRRAVDGSRPQ